jgi:hypothetical protein
VKSQHAPQIRRVLGCRASDANQDRRVTTNTTDTAKATKRENEVAQPRSLPGRPAVHGKNAGDLTIGAILRCQWNNLCTD